MLRPPHLPPFRYNIKAMAQTATKTLNFLKQISPICFQLSLVFVCLLFMYPSQLLAVSGEFNIRALVGEDLTPPTTPVLLAVEPVAPTQIDITWSTATDNLLMGGYVLLRDNLPIATTTLTSFIDIGLTPETLYTYAVYAFDQAGNVSTTSNALATTTLALPVIPVTPTSTAPTSATRVFELNNLEIIPDINSVRFTWNTAVASRFALRWGRSDAYTGGFIINDVFRKEHQTSVTGLEPGTIYLYELIGYLPSGREVVLSRGEFKTDARENITPVNVFNLQYQIVGQDVSLSWSLPQSMDDATVRVVRSHLIYPEDPFAGAIVYDGLGTNFYDVGALEFYPTQYYTVFVIDRDGSISSGAVLKVSQPAVTLPNLDIVPPILEPEIELPDFDFNRANITISQGADVYTFAVAMIVLEATDNFLISIPYDTLPKHLKSIVVTILDPRDQAREYSFLLRINKERTAYEAVVAALGMAGVSRFEIEIFDFEAQVVGRYSKQVDFVYSASVPEAVIFPDKIVTIFQPILSYLGLLAVILSFIIWLVFRKRAETEDKL